MKYDVFISYSSEDQKISEGICGYLERFGYRCFVAYRDIPPGIVWAGAITNAIDSSKMMVVVFSQTFNISPQTDREIELASEAKLPILTYRITQDSMTGAKKYYLKNLNWIDAFPNPVDYFGKLLESIKKLLGVSEKNTTNTFFFVQNRLLDLTEPSRHAVYKHYFLSDEISIGTLFFKVKECLTEMYAFHESLGYQVDKAREDYLLAEWIINNNRLNKQALISVVNSSTVDKLAHAIYEYRTNDN